MKGCGVMMTTNGMDKVLLSDDQRTVTIDPQGTSGYLFVWVERNGRPMRDREGGFVRLRVTPRGLVVADEDRTCRIMIRRYHEEGEQREQEGPLSLTIDDEIASKTIHAGGTLERSYGRVIGFNVPSA